MPTTTRPPCDVADAAHGSGTNSMTRLNYFNGRFLTAEALRAEQTYWDTRNRLVAQISPAGIAWGLSVSVDGEDFTLDPGLAFDGLGTPISVESPAGFSVSDLLAAYEQTPLVLQTTRGTNFVDCRCVAPSSGVTGPNAVQPGAYLLVIEATEVACGEAKVYGTTCNTSTSLCETNGWKAGWKVSLVLLPNAPAIPSDATACEARGVLSAWYFDTLENNLATRWSAPFPDDTFCGGPGPTGRFASPVPIGLAYIGSGRSLTAFDPWIPRRPIVATATAAWSTTALGAPSPAAAHARIHQFQCQLAQCDDEGSLFDRGFRHIPPFGFLPVDLSGVDNGEDTLDLAFTNIRQLDEAERQGKAYFAGTNVYTWCHVALHDDDLFEDLGDVFYKDPIFLDERRPVECPDLSDPCLSGRRVGFLILDWLLAPRGLTVSAIVNRETEFVKIIVPLVGLRRADPVEDPCATGTSSSDTATAAWRERVELAKRQAAGKSKRPVAEQIAEANGRPAGKAAKKLDRKGEVPQQREAVYLEEPAGDRRIAMEKAERTRRRLWSALGTPTSDWMPRQFVVYVKQRFVWFDVVFRIADALSDIAERIGALVAVRVGNTKAEEVASNAWRPIAASFRSPAAARRKAEEAASARTHGEAPHVVLDSSRYAYVDTGGLRGLLEQNPLRAIGYLRSAWDELWGICVVKDMIVRGALEIDGLDDPENWAVYLRRIRRGESRDDAIEYMILEREVEGWTAIKAAALILRPSQMDELEEAIYAEAKVKAENCPDDEPTGEPTSDLTCDAIEKSTMSDSEKRVASQLCCSTAGATATGSELVAAALALLGAVKLGELADSGSDSTLSIAEILLTDADTSARSTFLDGWVAKHGGDWCECLLSIAAAVDRESAPTLPQPETWNTYYEAFVKANCLMDLGLPSSVLDGVAAWVDTKKPTG